MKIVEILRSLRTPKASIIDVAIIGILALPFIDNPFYRGSYFTFYIFFLICLSLSLKPNFSYRSLPLSIFTLASLGTIFIHRPYKIVPGSIINSYFNVAIMSEGFIYLLAGTLLFFIVMRHAVHTRLILFASFISFIPCVKFMLINHSPVSLGLAFLFSVIIYLVATHHYRIVSAITAVGALFIAFNADFIVSKAYCRPEIWLACIKNIMQYPFVGSGFSLTIMGDGVFQVGQWQWVYRHNDYLYTWEAIGVVGFIAVIAFTITCLRQIGRSIYMIPVIFFVVLCNFKETMLLPERAAIVIIAVACCVKTALIKKERT